MAFLEEYCLSYAQDSSNEGDDFLRNRLRHHVMPLLKEENPRFAQSVSQMAMELRKDAAALEMEGPMPTVEELRILPDALRSRIISRFLKENGIFEPERSHIYAVDALIFSEKPSAMTNLPGGVIIAREYDRLVVLERKTAPKDVTLQPGDVVDLPQWGMTVSYVPAKQIINTKEIFTVNATGAITLRTRQAGDSMRLNVGTCTLKKLFIDRKIPAHQRSYIPVLADEQGVLGVWNVGANVDRLAVDLPAMQIQLKPLK
jgi:tRNA(Ile)-lysidine synthase